ncbi:MAG: outer membrane beta-barrel protein [Bacteroidetes bacterium]|nr:outer membrane beta-barrel protein [Bacteroidota bacterium]
MEENKIYHDDLFKDAGENYPLNTGNSNWHQVLNRINPTSEKAPVPSGQSQKWRFAWLLLLLLPAGYQFINNFQNKEKSKLPVNHQALQIPKGNLENSNPDQLTPLDKNQNESRDNGPLNSAGLRQNPFNEQSNNKQSNISSKQIVDNGFKFLDDQQNNNPSQQYNPLIQENSRIADFNFQTHLNEINKKSFHVEKFPFKPYPLELASSDLEKENNVLENKKSKLNVIKIKTTDRFYLALTAGPSFSSVKMQPIPKAGYSLGMLLGYNLTKNLDLETGVLFVKKYFNAEGKDFNEEEVKLPEGTNIISLNGAAKITQVPLNVIYHFNSKSSNRFFVSANVITNVIHSESYNYKLNDNETYNELSRSYKRGSDKLFSNLSIGAGYSQYLGNNWKMNIEPYYQFPLSGIGIGNLKIQTFGINLKISKGVQLK